MTLKFAMIGVAGYIAPRHLIAIKEIGGELLAAVDKSDSVGILDRYFPDAAFFTEFERFDRHLEKLKHAGTHIDYIVVCSPNYLHDPHIRFGLRYGAEVICEKPLILNPENAALLMQLEQQTGKKVYSVLQLRLNERIIALKNEIQAQKEPLEASLTYITARGKWYYASWKADEAKSGGIMTNIGIHLFDLLLWIFGPAHEMHLHQRSHDRASGVLVFKNARIRWFLSINGDTLPEELKQSGKTALRTLAWNDQVFDLSDGFEDLHTKTYREIRSGHGFRFADALPAIQLVWQLRQATLSDLGDTLHPFTVIPQDFHPFEKK